MSGHHGATLLEDMCTLQFVRNEEGEEALECSQDAISKAPVLPQSEEGSRYVLHSETEIYAVRVVVSQNQDHEETAVIAVWGRKLTSAEMLYHTYVSKLLAICDAVVNWYDYHHSDRNFTVLVNHASL